MTEKKRKARTAKTAPQKTPISSRVKSGKKAVSAKRNSPKARIINIKDEKTLGALGPQLNRLLNAQPGLAAMLFINPVLAMKEAGVKLSRPVVHHILSRLRHRPALRERREELETRLKERLCELPRPNNSAWLSRTLFEKLQLQALDIGDLTPGYTSPHDPVAEKRLQALRPKRTRRYSHLPSRPRRTGRVRLQELPSSVRRMDLNANVPELKPAKRTPKRLSLEDLYFYKDSSPVARDLLELAIIQRRGLRLHSRYSYRLIKEGKRSNVFRRWFRKVTLPEPEEKE